MTCDKLRRRLINLHKLTFTSSTSPYNIPLVGNAFPKSLSRLVVCDTKSSVFMKQFEYSFNSIIFLLPPISLPKPSSPMMSPLNEEREIN